jgi:hypothetical protein
MELLSDLASGFGFLTEEIRRICAAAGPQYQGYPSVCLNGVAPNTWPSFAITVFDTTKANIAHPCGQISHQTSYGTATPDAALAEVARLLGANYPLPPAEYLTATQSEEIQRLLNHPKITRREKTAVLLKYQQFSPERAAVCIARLRQGIEKRETEPLHQLAIAA